ncbi:hypothetical protein Fot_10449 [Forsythia ovata]|uniref:Secreted protein n=1 Tax=Forsythia ovata TaxID=205694 RepID=A0ABD1WGV9_9LAMI
MDAMESSRICSVFLLLVVFCDLCEEHVAVVIGGPIPNLWWWSVGEMRNEALFLIQSSVTALEQWAITSPFLPPHAGPSDCWYLVGLIYCDSTPLNHHLPCYSAIIPEP